MPQGGESTEGPAPAGTGGAVGTGGTATVPPAGTGGSAITSTGGSPAAPSATGGSPATGTGGTPAAVDSGVEPAPTTDAGPSAPPASGPDPESNYTCTRYYGINATAEWYGAGFETFIDNAKWELVRVHSGFIEKWAVPGDGFWNTAVTSACANGSKPDRIIFVGLNFDIADKAFWVKSFTAVVKNLKEKFPGLKRLELATFVRGPGNKPCPAREAKRSTIYPGEDEGIAEVVATDPVLLRAAPKFEVTNCSDFSDNPPHMSGGGGKNVARIIGEYYSGKAK